MGPLILGATGQIGRSLRQLGPSVWSAAPIWQSRTALPDHVHWDILNGPAPDVSCSGIILLAGRADSPADVHVGLAQKAADLGSKLGVRVLIASTQAVYGPQKAVLSEEMLCQNASPYGRAKLEAEFAVHGRDNVTCLRIGNVIGADVLLMNAAKGPVTLDRFPDGQAPLRAMIGMKVLAQSLNSLIETPDPLPRTLNLAQPGLVAMDALLEAAGVPWDWQVAPDTALPRLEMDLRAALSLLDLPPATPAQLVAEARAAGWSA